MFFFSNSCLHLLAEKWNEIGKRSHRITNQTLCHPCDQNHSANCEQNSEQSSNKLIKDEHNVLILKELLNLGGGLDRRNKSGLTPIDVALRVNNVVFIRTLLDIYHISHVTDSSC